MVIANERARGGIFVSIENFIHRIFRYKLKKYTYWDDPDNPEEAKKVPVNARHVKNMILAGCFDRIENVRDVTERYGILKRAAKELGFELSEKDFPEALRRHHYFWAQQQIAVSGLGSIDYRRIFDNSDDRSKVKGKASYITLNDVLKDENDGRRAAVCATVVEASEHTYQDRETGSRKRFGKLMLSQKKFDELLRFIDGRTEEDIIEEATSGWAEKDDEFANERFGGKYDFDRIKEMVHLYETALAQWRIVREDIVLSLPKEKQTSYREITKQVHARFYKDLVELKKIQY